jgi:hypothetical protein
VEEYWQIASQWGREIQYLVPGAWFLGEDQFLEPSSLFLGTAPYVYDLLSLGTRYQGPGTHSSLSLQHLLLLISIFYYLLYWEPKISRPVSGPGVAISTLQLQERY